MGGYFKKYLYVGVAIVVALIWIVINSVQSNNVSKLIDKEGLYTLATVKEIDGARSGRWVTVTFVYNGTFYETKGRSERISLNWIGEKIFVKFLPSNPIECKFWIVFLFQIF